MALFNFGKKKEALREIGWKNAFLCAIMQEEGGERAANVG